MKKFPKIIDNERIKLLDTLIEASGNYDQISIATGYWDLEATALLLPYLKKYKKIRLLIGREPLIPRHQLNEVEPDFPDKDIFEDLQRLKIDSNLNLTVKDLKQLVDNKILEVKVFKIAFLHAKCYIFGNFESETALGIIGSSNFTKNGLTTNRELNAGEDDQRVVQFNPKNETQEHGHLSWFEEVWTDDGCIDWSGQFIELVSGSNHGDLVYSPYEMYIKTLHFWYEDQLKDDRQIEKITGKTLAAFQERNVKQLLYRLSKFGVAMLADSVGLGKTISAIGVIKQYKILKQRVVVISPASLVLQWREELAEAGMYEVQVVSLQNKVEIENMMTIDKYAPIGLYVIDEAHNLRSSSSVRYKQLTEWIGNNIDSHTLLITATPINNSLADLSNQILLGSAGDQDILPINFKNDQGIIRQVSFSEAIENIKKRINQVKKRSQNISDEEQDKRLFEVYKEVREYIDPIMRAFVVRNTRDGIEREFGGVEIDGVLRTFPKVEMSNVKFDLDHITVASSDMSSVLKNISSQTLEKLADTTDILLHPRRQADTDKPIEEIGSEGIIELLYKVILSLSLVPYRYDMYHHEVYGKNRIDLDIKGSLAVSLSRQISLYGIIRTVFMKRLESSSKALKKSIEKYQRRLTLFESILMNQNKVVSLGDIDDIEDEYLAEDGEQLELNLDDPGVIEMIKSRAQDVSESTHNVVALKEDIASEKLVLKELLILADILDKDDTKITTYFAQVEKIKQNNPNAKILTFSFFTDTVNLIQEKIQQKNYFGDNSNRHGFVSGSNKNNAIHSAKLFAPKAKNYNLKPEETQIDYLVSTDVLAEGQNLQDCAIVINYDLHWNPVRMIQRNGRVNRLGSDHNLVQVVNMIPHTQVERFLKLHKTLQDKIEMIKATIGTDSSILGEEANPLDFTGVYSSNVATASEAYKSMESKAENFTDDEFINDLHDFTKNATVAEKLAIQYIPDGKWGMLHNADIYSLHFLHVTFDNGQSKNVVLYSQEGNYGAMLDGVALRKIRSRDKTRTFATLPPESTQISSKLQEKAEDFILYDTNISTRTLDSERKVLELVQNEYEWNGIDIEKLAQLFRTRNVITKKRVTQLKTAINSAVRNNADHKEYVAQLKLLLPQQQEPAPQIAGEIKQLTNFYNKTLWKS
ncbi:MAG: helicase-related protein [Candidatus Daviesbacteria bacterium]|nr:helicase-related protein [Candidatus Daviesbacteria bacterium]